MTITYDEADFLCVGCFGWARAKTAREAFRMARANSAVSMIKPEHRIFRVWRIADQIDEINVDDMGSWTGYPFDGVTIPKDQKASRLVWEGCDTTKIKDVPELPIEAIS